MEEGLDKSLFELLSQLKPKEKSQNIKLLEKYLKKTNTLTRSSTLKASTSTFLPGYLLEFIVAVLAVSSELSATCSAMFIKLLSRLIAVEGAFEHLYQSQNISIFEELLTFVSTALQSISAENGLSTLQIVDKLNYLRILDHFFRHKNFLPTKLV
jgi:hypothetical protein